MPPEGRRRISALCTGRNPAASLRCGNTSQALRASSPRGEPSLSGIRPWFVRRWYIRRGSWSGRICNAPLRCVARHRSPVGADYISARNPARRDRGPGGSGALRRGVGTPPYGLCVRRWCIRRAGRVRAAASRPYAAGCKFVVGATISRPPWPVHPTRRLGTGTVLHGFTRARKKFSDSSIFRNTFSCIIE